MLLQFLLIAQSQRNQNTLEKALLLVLLSFCFITIHFHNRCQ